MKHEHCVGPNGHPYSFSYVSWTGVLAGALVALGLGFLLNLFALALGLSAFSTDPQGARYIAYGGLIALTLASVVAMFVAGWVAGYLSRSYCFHRHFGAMYGFLAWALALLLAAILGSHITHFTNAQTSSVINPRTAAVAANTKDSDGARPSDASLENTADTLSKATYVTFFLFFVGALAASFGGYMGLNDDDNREHHHNHV